jgi:hypothetical protein
MATINELQKQYEAAQTRMDAWQQTIAAVNKAIADAEAELGTLVSTPHGADTPDALDRMTVLRGRIASGKLFIEHYQYEGVKMSVTSAAQNASSRYFGAKQAADALPAKLNELEREVRETRKVLKAATADE